jgi:outer membrane usher protein
VARLGIKRGNVLLVDLVGSDGKPVAVGSQAFLNGATEANPIGYGGQLFLRDVAEHNHVAVETPEGARCEARFDRVDGHDAIPEIGPVTCRAAPSRVD